MKITIIGAGHIGGATAIGLAGCGLFGVGDITVTARHTASLKRFKPYGIHTSLDNVSAVQNADIVVYAVKPWQMQEVVLQTVPYLDYDKQSIVSLAPGIKPDTLKEWFTQDGRLPSISYVIPNTAIEIGESMTYIAAVTSTESETSRLKGIFDLVGTAQVVDLEKMLAGTSLASCGIAYAMRYISAASQGGRELGLDPESTDKAVCQTVKGAAELIARHGSNPESELDKVTTPGGLTLRGLRAMEAGGFSQSIIDGLTVNSSLRRRIVVKVGSNVLTRHDGALDTTRVSSLVDQIVELRNMGFEVVLVTSGAVACGRSLIREDRKLDEVQQRQLYSAIGQVRLMDLYYKLFINYGVTVGQILTMKKNFSTRREYLNQRNCMEVMLQSGVLPIVNENDTVSIKELMFTDNDELSGLVAAMVGAETLIILTNVDGVYSGSPSDPNSEVLRTIVPEDGSEACISDERSERGRGGMASKYSVARNAAAAGIRVIIANGKRDNILPDVLCRPEDTIHTEFIPQK